MCVVVTCRNNFQNLLIGEYEFISTIMKRNIKCCMKTKLRCVKLLADKHIGVCTLHKLVVDEHIS